MSAPKNNTDATPEVIDFSFKDFLKACLAKWVWFVLCIVVSLALAAAYIYMKQPVYERSEEILITDSDSGGGVGDITSAFSTLGLFSNNSSVYNELISLKSPAIMLQVVKRLELDKNYLTRKDLKPKTLYGANLPVNVDMLDIDEQATASFKFDLNPDGSAKLYKFIKYTSTGKEKYSEEVTLPKGGEVVKTPLGKIKITPNPGYKGKPLEEPLTIRFSKQALQVAVEAYCAKLKGDLVDQDAEVIGLSIEDVSTQRAVDILNAVLEVYNENWVDDKNKMAIATSAFIEERLRVIERELGDTDEALAKYRSGTGSVDLGTIIKLNLEKDAELQENIVNLSNQLAMTEYLKDHLKDSAKQLGLIPANSGLGNPSIEAEISAYNTLVLDRNKLVENSSASNPLVSSYDNQLKDMHASIAKSLDNNIVRINSMLRSAKAEKAKAEGQVASTPTKALPMLSETRQQKVKETLYLFLLQKREENELSQTFTAYNTRVITPPMGSLDPVSPRTKLIYIIAFLLGLGVPLGAMYLAEASDNKVRSRKDLERVKMPFAGEIPHVGKKKKLKVDPGKHKSLKDEKPPMSVVEEGKRDVVNEAFRVIRSNIDFMAGKNGGCEVIMLTSFNPGSGKSFIAYNLGLSFALKKKKVLLLDCDLRHGSSSMYIGMPPKGLTNYLTGATDDWQALVVKSPANPYLSILPIGKMPPNPAELLEDGRIGKLIEQAKEDYDYILLDCPPVNIVVDTQIVGQYADRTLFVVRAGLLERSALKELDEFYAEKRFRHMSVILNGTEAAHSRYYTYGNYQHLE